MLNKDAQIGLNTILDRVWLRHYRVLTICQTRKLQLTWIHFSEMSNTIFTSEIPEADTFVENHDFSEECYNDDSPLNSLITVNEILEAVNTLKIGKSCDNDF